MSRPRYYWYGFVQKTVRRYPDKLKQTGTIQSSIAAFAIEKAITEIKSQPEGAEKLRLIELLYWQKDFFYSLDQAADMMFISPRLAQKWNSEFIYTVAKHMGYL